MAWLSNSPATIGPRTMADTICGMYNSHLINKSYEVRQTTEPLCNSYGSSDSSIVDIVFAAGLILMLIVLL